MIVTSIIMTINLIINIFILFSIKNFVNKS